MGGSCWIGAVRSGTGIEAIVLEPVAPFRVSRPGDLVGTAYRIGRIPLAEGRLPADCPRGDCRRLLSDWSALSEVKALDAPTLARAIRVLLGTRLAAGREERHLPALDPDEEKRRFRPTAAHPRDQGPPASSRATGGTTAPGTS